MAVYTTEDLKQAFLSVLRNKLLIILITGAGFFAGMFYTARQSTGRSYSATATISVAFGENLGQISGSTIITNYSEIAISKRVCEYAATLLDGEELSSDQIQQMIEISVENNSFMLKISARNDSPLRAILVANAVAESFVTQLSILTGSNTIQVIDAARTADLIDSDRSNSVRLIFTAIAFIAACALVIIIELLLGTLRSVKQCIISEGELLAVIPTGKLRSRHEG